MENTNKEILEAIQMLATKMDQGFKSIDERFDRLEKKVDAIQQEVDHLKKWKDVVDFKLNELFIVEKVTKENCYQIALLKATK